MRPLRNDATPGSTARPTASGQSPDSALPVSFRPSPDDPEGGLQIAVATPDGDTLFYAVSAASLRVLRRALLSGNAPPPPENPPALTNRRRKTSPRKQLPPDSLSEGASCDL